MIVLLHIHGALYNWRGNSFSRWVTRGLFTRRKNMGNLDISSLKHVSDMVNSSSEAY